MLAFKRGTLDFQSYNNGPVKHKENKNNKNSSEGGVSPVIALSTNKATCQNSTKVYADANNAHSRSC